MGEKLTNKFLAALGLLCKLVGSLSACLAQTLATHIPFFFIALSGLAVIGGTFQDVKQDTTSLTNSAFAILAGISALCFSWARVIDKKDTRDMVISLGERSFQASITFLFASVLKYVAINFDKSIFKHLGSYSTAIKFILQICFSMLFLWALQISMNTLSSLNDLLWEKYGWTDRGRYRGLADAFQSKFKKKGKAETE